MVGMMIMMIIIIIIIIIIRRRRRRRRRRSTFLGDTNRAGSHSNPKSVTSSINEILCLSLSDHVSSNNVHVGKLGFNVLDQINLPARVS